MSEKKAKVATACMCGCSGCHMSFLDIDEYLIDLVEKVDIEASHMIVDTKYGDFPKVDVGIVEGTMTNEENVRVVKELREKCDLLIAWGDCACFGGIHTMRNFYDAEDCLKNSYLEKADSDSKIPSPDGVPELLEEASAVDKYVEVDVYIPGCPPSAELIKYGLTEVLKGNIPKLTEERLDYD